MASVESESSTGAQRMLCDEILITVTARGRSSLSKTPELTCDYCRAGGGPASDHAS